MMESPCSSFSISKVAEDTRMYCCVVADIVNLENSLKNHVKTGEYDWEYSYRNLSPRKKSWTLTVTGRDTCTLLLCDRLRLTDGCRLVLYVTWMVVCFQTDHKRTSHPSIKDQGLTIVWSVDASL